MDMCHARHTIMYIWFNVITQTGLSRIGFSSRRQDCSIAMTDDDVFNGSTTALSFEKFIAKINQESARDLVKNINMYDFKKLGCGLILLIQYPPLLCSFMKNFRQKPPDVLSDSNDVQEFMRFMEQAFARHPLWAGCSQEDIDAATEVRDSASHGRSSATSQSKPVYDTRLPYRTGPREVPSHQAMGQDVCSGPHGSGARHDPGSQVGCLKPMLVKRALIR